MLLAQTLEVFLAAESGDAALVIVKQRRAKWLDPDLVKAAPPAFR